jgi:RNA polymerase sigma-70 factor (ECF subfamily)
MLAPMPEVANLNASCVWPGHDLPKQNNIDEGEVVARAQAGDEVAFREIVECYASRIYRVAYGILRNRDDADEIAQDVFAKVHFSISAFAGRSSFYSWIHRITINQCYGVLRKKRIKLVHSSDFPDEPLALRIEGVPDGRPTPDRIALQRDFVNKLLACIPEDDRWLLISKEVEGLSVAELSEITGLNPNTIKVRLFRIRQGLVAAAARLRSGRRRSDNGTA